MVFERWLVPVHCRCSPTFCRKNRWKFATGTHTAVCIRNLRQRFARAWDKATQRTSIPATAWPSKPSIRTARQRTKWIGLADVLPKEGSETLGSVRVGAIVNVFGIADNDNDFRIAVGPRRMLVNS